MASRWRPAVPPDDARGLRIDAASACSLVPVLPRHAARQWLCRPPHAAGRRRAGGPTACSARRCTGCARTARPSATACPSSSTPHSMRWGPAAGWPPNRPLSAPCVRPGGCAAEGARPSDACIRTRCKRRASLGPALHWGECACESCTVIAWRPCALQGRACLRPEAGRCRCSTLPSLSPAPGGCEEALSASQGRAGCSTHSRPDMPQRRARLAPCCKQHPAWLRRPQRRCCIHAPAAEAACRRARSAWSACRPAARRAGRRGGRRRPAASTCCRATRPRTPATTAPPRAAV